MPCRSFPKIYGFIERSDLEVILQTCNNTDIPPNPSRNAVKIIFNDISLIFIKEINEIPFVISKIPVNRGTINEDGICKISNMGLSKLEKI